MSHLFFMCGPKLLVHFLLNKHVYMMVSQGNLHSDLQYTRLKGVRGVTGGLQFRSRGRVHGIGMAVWHVQALSSGLWPPPRSRTRGKAPQWTSHCMCRGVSASPRRRRTADPGQSPGTPQLFWVPPCVTVGLWAPLGLSDLCPSPDAGSGSPYLCWASGSPALAPMPLPHRAASPVRPLPPPSSGVHRCNPAGLRHTASHRSVAGTWGLPGVPGHTACAFHHQRWAGLGWLIPCPESHPLWMKYYKLWMMSLKNITWVFSFSETNFVLFTLLEWRLACFLLASVTTQHKIKWMLFG